MSHLKVIIIIKIAKELLETIFSEYIIKEKQQYIIEISIVVVSLIHLIVFFFIY